MTHETQSVAPARHTASEGAWRVPAIAASVLALLWGVYTVCVSFEILTAQ